MLEERKRRQEALDRQEEEEREMRSKGKNEIRETSVGTVGSDNVFADLGLPDAETRLLKARLVSKIDDVIEKRGLTQAGAGRVMGLPQPKVSELRNGRTNDYSIERLYRLLNSLGVGISVVLQEQPDWSKGDVEVKEATSLESEREPAMSFGM
jgi:predicted XRE-type DNA-binding protein